MERKTQESFIKIGNMVFSLDTAEGFEAAREAMKTFGLVSLPVCFGSPAYPLPSKHITLYADPEMYADVAE